MQCCCYSEVQKAESQETMSMRQNSWLMARKRTMAVRLKSKVTAENTDSATKPHKENNNAKKQRVRMQDM